MQIESVITRLKDNCSATNIFKVGSTQARIAGASEFDKVEDDQMLAVPSLFVLLAPGSISDFQYKPSFKCEFKESLFVMIVLDAKSDRRGQTPQQQIHAIKWWLASILQGWSPDENWEGLYMEEDRVWKTTPARYYHYFTFSQFITLDEDMFTRLTEADITDLRSIVGDIDITVDEDTAVIPEIEETGLYPTTYTFADAGTAAVDGDYVHALGDFVTTLFMRPIYRKGLYSAEWSEDNQRWENKDATTIYYVNTSTSQFLPEEGWSAASGEAPVPTVTQKEE